VPALLVTLIGLGALAFGAVSPWGYLPLFAAAALIGIVGLLRFGMQPELRLVAAGLVLVFTAVAAQLLPIPRGILASLSPHTVEVLSQYSPAFANNLVDAAPLSINPRRTWIAVMALGAFGLYLVGVPGLLSRRALRQLPGTLAVFAVPFALFGVYSRENLNGLVYWFWSSPDGGGGDLFGPFVNRNHFAGWMLMTVCVLVGSLFGQIESASPGGGALGPQRRLAWLSSAQANGLLMMGAAVLVTATSLFWTMSRSAMTGFGVAGVAFLWLVSTRRGLGTTRRSVAVAALGIAIFMGVMRRGPALIAEWFQDERDLLSRLEAWRDGWDVVRDFPLWGTGLNTYSDAMLFYQHRNPGYHLATAHNDYLQVLAEGGLIVVIPAAAAIILLARAILRNLRAAAPEARGYWIRAGAAVGLLAMAVQEVFEFSLQIPADSLLFCTLAAVALAPVHASTRRSSGETADRVSDRTAGTMSRDNIPVMKSRTDAPLPQLQVKVGTPLAIPEPVGALAQSHHSQTLVSLPKLQLARLASADLQRRR
jgi:O-antigen ligase